MILHIKKAATRLLLAGLCALTTPAISAETLSSEEQASIQQKFTQLATDPGTVMFSPPTGWQLADPKALPSSIKIMVVGKSSRSFPPSMNLTSEPYSGTLKQYLKKVKAINESQGDEWKDLGTIRTEAGDASLSQADMKSEWGKIRLMHVILLRNHVAYILTASALQEEFPNFYESFFQSMKSLRVNPENPK